MIRLPFHAGGHVVHHCKLIGTDPRHKAMLRRNEERLAALKSAKRLTEAKIEPIATGCRAVFPSAYNNAQPYQAGSALACILGLSSTDKWDQLRTSVLDSRRTMRLGCWGEDSDLC